MSGGVEKIRSNAHNDMTHARVTWDEWRLEPCRPLSQCRVRTKKNNQTMTLTTKRKRLHKPSCGSIHKVHRVSVHSTCCCACRSCISCHQFNCCQRTKFIHFLTCTGIRSHDVCFGTNLDSLQTGFLQKMSNCCCVAIRRVISPFCVVILVGIQECLILCFDKTFSLIKRVEVPPLSAGRLAFCARLAVDRCGLHQRSENRCSLPNFSNSSS